MIDNVEDIVGENGEEGEVVAAMEGSADGIEGSAAAIEGGAFFVPFFEF